MRSLELPAHLLHRNDGYAKHAHVSIAFILSAGVRVEYQTSLKARNLIEPRKALEI